MSICFLVWSVCRGGSLDKKSAVDIDERSVVDIGVIWLLSSVCLLVSIA